MRNELNKKWRCVVVGIFFDLDDGRIKDHVYLPFGPLAISAKIVTMVEFNFGCDALFSK